MQRIAFCCWASWNLAILPADSPWPEPSAAPRSLTLRGGTPVCGAGRLQGDFPNCCSPVGRVLGVSENVAEQKVEEEKDWGPMSLVNKVAAGATVGTR